MRSGRKEIFYLTTHSTDFYSRFYGVWHMVKDHSVSERKLHGLFFQRDILYAPSNRIAHITAFSRWAVAKTRISSMGQPRGIDPAIHCTTNGSSSTELHLASRCAMRAVYCQSLLPTRRCATTRDRSGDPLHHERKLFHGAPSGFPLRDADRTLSVSTTNTSVCNYGHWAGRQYLRQLS